MAREIVLSTEIKADRPTLFEALTTSRGLAAFWTPSSLARPEVGSEARFEFSGAPVPLLMRVDSLDPQTGVEWTCTGHFPHWLGSRVTWGFLAGHADDCTTLLFKHTGLADEQPEHEFGSVAYTWATVLGALKTHAESGVSAPALG